MATTFEAFLAQGADRPNRSRTITYGLSLAVHGGLLAVAALYSFWRTEELSPPSPPLVLLTAPPPPPAPPAAAPAAAPPRRSATRTVRPRPTVVPQPDPAAQPAPAPAEESPAQAPGDGEKPGTGTTTGGVGTGDPSVSGPGTGRFLAPTIARGQLAIDPQSDRYRVKLPPALARTGMSLWALVKLCVARDGQVNHFAFMRRADPTVDPIIEATLRTWRYRPFTIDGRPVPFCTNVRYEITAR